MDPFANTIISHCICVSLSDFLALVIWERYLGTLVRIERRIQLWCQLTATNWHRDFTPCLLPTAFRRLTIAIIWNRQVNVMDQGDQQESTRQRRVSRRTAIKVGGIAALGLAFSKPVIETVYAKTAFSQLSPAPTNTPPSPTTTNTPPPPTPTNTPVPPTPTFTPVPPTPTNTPEPGT